MRATSHHRKARRVIGIVAVLLIVVVVVVPRVLAPSQTEIIERSTSARSTWRGEGMVTRYSTVLRQRDPLTGEKETIRREHWVSYDGTHRRQANLRVGTPRTFESIFKPDSLRTGNIAEETSSTFIANESYLVRNVETVEGSFAVVDTTLSARHAVWWGPCGSCHMPRANVSALTTVTAGLPPYLSPQNRTALKVVGRGKVRGRPTYVLEAVRPSMPDGYSEITRIDVDRTTYLPLRYRIDVVQDLGAAGSDLIESSEIDITSHELVRESRLPEEWWELSLPSVGAYSARQPFPAWVVVSWPPQGSTPPREPVTPPVYDIGAGDPMGGVFVGGVHFPALPPWPGSVDNGVKARPDAVIEELRSAPDAPLLRRVIAEYGEIAPPGTNPRFGEAEESLEDGSGYIPLLRVITLPLVDVGTVLAWGQSASLRVFGVAGHQAFEIRGAQPDAGLRPFDRSAILVQMPDATVVVTQPPQSPDVPALVREAANRLVRRQ